MKADVMLVTFDEKKNLVERKIGAATVTRNTDLKDLFTKLAAKHFGNKFNVRRDSNLFKFCAVAPDGDCIILR
jgi:hypothetical protein